MDTVELKKKKIQSSSPTIYLYTVQYSHKTVLSVTTWLGGGELPHQ